MLRFKNVSSQNASVKSADGRANVFKREGSTGLTGFLIIGVGVLVSLATVASYLLRGYTPGLLGGVAVVGLLLVDCVLTGIVEEVLFRGLLFRGLERLGLTQKSACILQVVLFGLAHLWAPWPKTLTAVVFAQAFLKVLTATCFAFLMTEIYLRKKSLLQPILLHIAYDVVVFMPVLVLFGFNQETYLTGVPADLLPLATALLLLAGLFMGKGNRGRSRGAEVATRSAKKKMA